MKYKTSDEWNHFDWAGAYIGEVQVTDYHFSLGLANVKILPENSKNRDIRLMRTNELYLTLAEPTIAKVVEEGYKEYDPDGNLKRTVGDVEIAAEERAATVKSFEEGSIYSMEKTQAGYLFYIDTEEHTYQLLVQASGDSEEWDRFLNLESM